MQAIESECIEEYRGYEIHMDDVGAIAYINGHPAMRSVTISLLKRNLDVVISEEQRHAEEYK